MRSVLLLATALALSGCATPQGPGTTETAARRQSIDTAQVDVERYKDVLARSLKDPTSAQFRDVYVAQRSADGLPALCGEVNGKNSYGGYGGFERFAVVRLPSGEMTSFIV